VAELLAEKLPTPMQRVGVQDTFAESGPYLEVIDKYGLTARHIIKAVNAVLKRKPFAKTSYKAKSSAPKKPPLAGRSKPRKRS
jgi:hypothetical protein